MILSFYSIKTVIAYTFLIVIQFVSLKLMMSYLNDIDIEKIILFTATCSIFQTLTTGPATAYLVRYNKGNNDINLCFQSILINIFISIILILLIGIIYVLFKDIIINMIGYEIFWASLILGPLYSLLIVFSQYFQNNKKPMFSMALVSFPIIVIIIEIVLVRLNIRENSINLIKLIYFAFPILMIIAGSFFYKFVKQVKIKKIKFYKLYLNLPKIILPALILGPATIFMGAGERWIISEKFELVFLTKYYFLYFFSYQAISHLGLLSNKIFLPLIFNLDTKKYEKIKKLKSELYIFTIVTFAYALFVLLTKEYIISVFSENRVTYSNYTLIFAVSGAYLMVASNIMYSIYLENKNTSVFVKIYYATLILYLGLMYFLPNKITLQNFFLCLILIYLVRAIIHLISLRDVFTPFTKYQGVK